MRKITGYIGALIIVMSLMGSILAGYALNINGESAVTNEYENVTDVSGLYSHTEEKTYIDYNPASNYIGYTQTPNEYTNEPQNPNYKYKSIQQGTVTITRNAGISINGGPVNPFPVNTGYLGSMWIMLTDKGFGFMNGANPSIWLSIGGEDNFTTVTITVNLPTITYVYDNNRTVNTAGNTVFLIHSPTDYDYIGVSNSEPGINPNIHIRTNDKIVGMANDGSTWGTFINTTWTGVDSISKTIQPITAGTVTDGVRSCSLIEAVSGFDASSVVTTYPVKAISTPSNKGINYSESNRVNNYPIEYETQGTTGVIRTNVNLYNVALSDYYEGGRYYTGDVPRGSWNGYEYYGPTNSGGGAKQYKILDVLSTITIPDNTTQIIIETGNLLVNVNGNIDLGTVPNIGQAAQNTASIVIPVGSHSFTSRALFNSNGFKSYYNPATGIVDTYDYNGVKLFTSSINDTYVTFFSENNAIWAAQLSRNGSTVEHRGTWTYTTAPQAYLDISMITNGSVEIAHYMDITRGVSIKDTNTTPTIWDNQYENGTINLLFRAEETYANYHNTFTVSDNTISVDYTDNRFYVTLNGGEPVDIGTWRNIMLNINLNDKTLTVSPVRTFNSYTNVITDNALINVGELNADAAPTNTISWDVTPNSLTFSVYNTSVFLNTYGVVMVNPSLNITNYFTDLNDFYKLDLTNFSVYGDTITVNGVTGTVNGNTVTFGDEDAVLSTLSIIYADGNAYIQDSHAVIDLGPITSNDVILTGVWYFETTLYKGFTQLKQIYNWDWGAFIFDNTQFCVFYIGLALVGLVIAKKFCTMSFIDYAVLITSIIIALSVQVIA